MPVNANTQYDIRVWYDSPGMRDAGLVFGKFSSKEKAEECLIVLAGRVNVKQAQIEISEGV